MSTRITSPATGDRPIVPAVVWRVMLRPGFIAYLLLALLIINFRLQPALLNVDQIGFQIQSGLPLVFLAVAQAIVVLTRGIDLSVGGIMVVTNVLTATALGGASGGKMWLFPLIILLGAALGLINGVLVTYVHFEPFIATLATWAIYDGVALNVLPTDGGVVPSSLINIVNGVTVHVDNSYIILGVLTLAAIYIQRIRFGQKLIAVGTDEDRAMLNGIDTRRIKLTAYVLSGLLSGLGGIYLAAETSTGTPGGGDGFILTSIVAVVISGASLLGGRASAVRAIAAAFVLAVIANLVTVLALQPYVSVVATSALLLFVVSVDSLRRKFGRQAT